MPLLTTGAGKYPAAGSGYTGLGDIVSGALFYWGLRAYSSATAAALANCIDIMSADGVHTSTLALRANGTVNTTSIAAGDMAGDTLANWLIAFGPGAARVHKIYDQVGTLHATAAVLGPDLSTTANGGKGAMVFAGVQPLITAGTITQAQPYSISTISARTGSTSANDGILGTDSPYPLLIGHAGAATQLELYGGTNPGIIAGASEGVDHSIQWIVKGTTSIVNLDGTDAAGGGAAAVTPTPGTSTITASKLGIGERAGGVMAGRIAEICMWSGDKAANMAALWANQKAWWGTP